MQAIDPPLHWLRLGDIVSAATVTVGGLTSASYSFALGYIFAIEPRFRPSFPFGGLLLLFMSSTSVAIFAAIALTPGSGLLLTRGLHKAFLQRTNAHGDRVGSQDAVQSVA